jgi:hypothetical protein
MQNNDVLMIYLHPNNNEVASYYNMVPKSTFELVTKFTFVLDNVYTKHIQQVENYYYFFLLT